MEISKPNADSFVFKAVCDHKNWQQNAASDANESAGERQKVIVLSGFITEYTKEYRPEEDGEFWRLFSIETFRCKADSL